LNSFKRITSNYRNKKDVEKIFEAELFVKDSTEPNRMKIRMPLNQKKFVNGNFDIMSTDYDTYAIIYSCQSFGFGFFNIGNMKLEFGWLLLRDRSLELETIEIPDEFKSFVGNMGNVPQENCD
jgi:hypothetical protein